MFTKKNKIAKTPDGFKLLITVDDTIEADIIESKLNASGIKILRNYREPGAYLTLVLGKTTMGVDIFVTEDKLEEAKGFLESAKEVSDADILADPSFSDESIKAQNTENLKKISIGMWILMSIFFIVFVAVIVLYFFNG